VVVDVAAGVEVVEVVAVVDVVVVAAAVTEAAAHRGAAAVIVEWMQFLAHRQMKEIGPRTAIELGPFIPLIADLR
jgi:hypothetical protein